MAFLFRGVPADRSAAAAARECPPVIAGMLLAALVQWGWPRS